MRKDDEQLEVLMIGLAIAAAVVSLLVPFLIFKSIENEPGYYEGEDFKSTAKVASLMFMVVGLLVVAEALFPEVDSYSLFQLGHLELHSKVLVHWTMLNLILGGFTYLTVPMWKGLLKKKARLKDQLY